MKNNNHTVKQMNTRAKIILTAVIPALIPWGVLLFHNLLPGIITKFFLITKGWLAWTLFEYYMHRWAFHKPRSKDGIENDPFNHTHHHTHPDDMILKNSHRAIAIFIIVASISTLFWGPALISYFAGILAGSAAYILVHWLLHQHYTAILLPTLVKQHIWHHCKYTNKCFGITTIFWDKIFKSLPPDFKTIPDNTLQFYFKHEGLAPEMIHSLGRKINSKGKFDSQTA